MNSPGTRQRNRRGEGSKLKQEIVAAGSRLLEADGRAESVTLRAIAREVGISAPSIYNHFPDREAIVSAVIDAAFGDFLAELRVGLHGLTDPVQRIDALARAYLAFAAEHPHGYRLLFDRPGLEPEDSPGAPVRQDSFTLLTDTLQDCVDAGLSTSSAVFSDATSIWVALHGLASLRGGIPGFPWPDEMIMLDNIVRGLGHIRQD